MLIVVLSLVALLSASPHTSEMQERTASPAVLPPSSGTGFPGMVPCVEGDNPPATAFSWTGNGGVAVDVVAAPGQSGTFSISDIPEDASIVWAFLYEASWESLPTSTASAIFAGTPLPPVLPFDHDPGVGYDSTKYFDLCAYRWGVTHLVTGNGDYDYSVSLLALSYAQALVVVYGHPVEPSVQIIVNDGCESLYRAQSISTFAGVAGDSATLYLFTQADESSGDRELISMNEEVILGPGSVFNGNAGLGASLFELPVLCVSGSNVVSCSTDIDWFGWHLAVLEAPAWDLVQLEDASGDNPLALMQNSPNPFHRKTAIRYSISSTSHVKLDVYDLSGRLIETLVNETQQPGIRQVHWNRKTNPSGVYFYTLKACPERSSEHGDGQSRRAGEFVETRKMVLLD